MKTPMIISAFVAVSLCLGSTLPVYAESAKSSETLMLERCSGCHRPNSEGGLNRIREQRKTPEGWLMTLVRMQKLRGAYLTDDERSLMVKHLSDTQGLAPAETADFRYILERRENTPEQWADPVFGEMCARCHSGARVGIQRRSEIEWKRLVHFHLGQYATTEYSYQGRDREWLKIAEERTVPLLAERYPFESALWDQWQVINHPSLAGRWRLVGHQPGRGDYEGYLTVVASNDDNYVLNFNGQYTDGEKVIGSGVAIVYTGYEWRATITLNGVQQQQILAVNKDSTGMTGRMFVADENEKGTDLTLVRVGTTTAILGVYPNHVKAGTNTELTIIGTHLKGDIVLPKGLTLITKPERSSDRIRLNVKASANASTQPALLNVGEAQTKVVIYQKVDAIAVEPAYAVARVGGGTTPKVQGVFEAVGMSAGADGILGNDDDIRIGFFPATWSVEPFDEVAKHDHDVDFTGTMNTKTGVFTPESAGPNRKRRFSTNNVGNLAVVAKVSDAESELEAKAQLIVTVQRWNNAPIR